MGIRNLILWSLFSLWLPLDYVFGQSDLSTHFLTSIVQSSYNNPAQIPEGLNIALPGGFLDFYHSAGSVATLLDKQESQRILRLSLLDVNSLDEKEFVDVQGAIEPLTVTWLNDRLSLGFTYQIQTKALMVYDKTIPELLLQGNSKYIGETVDLNFDTQVSLHHMYGFAVGYHLPYFAIAGRLKYYSGIFNLETENGQAQLSTEADTYVIDYSGDYSFFKSGDLLQYSDREFRVDGSNILNSFIGRNFGLAADLGFKLNLSDQFNINASILDLGQIRWRKNPERWTSSKNTSIQGVDLTGFLDEQDLNFQALSDTLERFLDLNVQEERYNTTLPTRIYLGMQYDVNPLLTIGMLYAREYNNNDIFPTLAAQVTTHFGEIFHLGTVYSTKHDVFTNLGLHFVVQLGPLQLYGVTDNLFDTFQFKPYSNAHVRGGINLQFKFDQ